MEFCADSTQASPRKGSRTGGSGLVSVKTWTEETRTTCPGRAEGCGTFFMTFPQ
jgi:hypothetical protein